jgi:hypothetical protein
MKDIKKLLKMFVFTAGLALLGACSESEYEIPNLFPDEYHKILYLLESGEQEVTLYITGESMSYRYAVVKAGSESTLEAEVNMRVMSQPEVDTKWSDLTGIPHYVIPASSYTLGETNLKFGATDAFKNLDITIIPEEVNLFVEQKKAEDPLNADYMKFVLPVLAEGATRGDSINSQKNYVMITVSNILEPTIGFADTDIHEQFIGQGNTPIGIPVNLDVANQWTFTSRVVVDEEYITTYNAANNTNYLPFPASAITAPDMVNFTPGNQGLLNIRVDYTALEKTADMDKNYMLALKLEKDDLFGVSPTNNRYVLATTYRMQDRSSWGWSVNSESSQEGTNGWLRNVYDGNIASYWHSNYGNGSGVVNRLPYSFTIDMKEARTVCTFGLCARQSANNSDLKAGYFETSSDGVTWTQVGTWSMAKGLLPEQLYPITPVTARYLRINIMESHRSQNAGVGEINIYGY